MSAKVQILEFAKEDYRKIRRWVKAEFGLQVWSKIEAEYKILVSNLFLKVEKTFGRGEIGMIFERHVMLSKLSMLINLF